MSTSLLDRSSAPAPGEVRPFDFPKIHRFRLSNGIPVIAAQTTGLPVATLSTLLPAGALRESGEKAGLARLTASLLESGTESRSAAEVSEQLESMGIRLSAGTGWETAHADFTALTDYLDQAAALMAEIVRRPSFPDAEVERLRGQQIAAILQRRAEPRGFANELANRFVFADSAAYTRPVGGYRETVSALERADVDAFHALNYSPARSALIAAGSFEPQALKDLLEDSFGDWEGEATGPIEPSAAPRFATRQVVLVNRPGAVQSEIRVGHLGAARETADYFAILVMNSILGGAFSSRLNLNLREKHGFTYGVRSSFVMRREPGPFLVSTAVQTEVTGAAVREIFNELDRIRDGHVTPSELDDARQYVAGTFPLALQTTDGIASRLAELFIYDLPDRYLQDFAGQILDVNADHALHVARTYVRPDRAVTVVLGDAEKIRDDLAALELGPIEVVEAESLR